MARMAMLGPWVASGWPVESDLGSFNASLLQEQMALQGAAVFKRCTMSPDELVGISRRFGGKEVVARHVDHEQSPHEEILRLSNKAAHGVTLVGPQWHQDGSTERVVFSHVLLHALTESSATELADLAKAYEFLPAEVQERWSRMASVNAYSGAVHPLVHRHPISGKKVLFLHLGQTGAIVEWNGTGSWQGPSLHAMAPLEMPPSYRALAEDEVAELMKSYALLLERPEVRRSLRYEAGDLLVIDNLAMAHRASLEAHDGSKGLRLLHRTTVAGTTALDAPHMPAFLYIFGARPFKKGLWQSADYHGVGFRWNTSASFRN